MLTESRIPFKPLKGHFPFALINELNKTHKTESVVYWCCMFSLFLKDPFSRSFRISPLNGLKCLKILLCCFI